MVPWLAVGDRNLAFADGESVYGSDFTGIHIAEFVGIPTIKKVSLRAVLCRVQARSRLNHMWMDPFRNARSPLETLDGHGQWCGQATGTKPVKLRQYEA